jgi:arginine/lysine/ornithine decarboxylase
VDEAHARHLFFNDNYADAMSRVRYAAVSMHKSGGCLTQSSLYC